MPLQIIGAGFGRNGTLSLKTALEELGFKPCYHMIEAHNLPEHIPIWTALHDGTTDPDTFDWEILFKDYYAAVDWPACTHWESQMKYYPDAKVILAVRDPEAWYKSMCQTIFQVVHVNSPWYGKIVSYFPPFRKWVKFSDAMFKCFDNRLRIGNQKDKEHVIRCYNEHTERVKARVPKDRLLVFQVKEGWGPLCKFLNVPVPKTPFPNVNDTKEFQQNYLRKRNNVHLVAFLALSTAVGVGLYGTISLFPDLKSGCRKGINSLINFVRGSATKSDRLLTF